MKPKNILSYTIGLISLLFLIVQACNSSAGPKPIRYGQDQCAYCKMTVSDPRFGAQLVTKKGRAYNFDDVKCMIAFVKEGTVKRDDVAGFYLPDYSNDNKLLPAEKMFLLKSESLKSPMRGNIAAFANEKDMEQARAQHAGDILIWDDLWK
ncbi:nitrous oxide reductase accessory protein NosL [Sphingobacterium lumbrici]|uniref:nitrous oxide reductase accessory protein NosL n=1 Tax=Sphingobacterium lumbrici TaxID=2559600 RepID=UPI001C11FA07|nr:nitrous oxide reductase accessory protein NosL [Sphingobacterium lumbrici]